MAMKAAQLILNLGRILINHNYYYYAILSLCFAEPQFMVVLDPQSLLPILLKLCYCNYFNSKYTFLYHSEDIISAMDWWRFLKVSQNRKCILSIFSQPSQLYSTAINSSNLSVLESLLLIDESLAVRLRTFSGGRLESKKSLVNYNK